MKDLSRKRLIADMRLVYYKTIKFALEAYQITKDENIKAEIKKTTENFNETMRSFKTHKVRKAEDEGGGNGVEVLRDDNQDTK